MRRLFTVHQPALFQLANHQRDRRAVERGRATERDLVLRAVVQQRIEHRELQRRQVEALALVEKDRDRDLVAAAQQVPRHAFETIAHWRSPMVVVNRPRPSISTTQTSPGSSAPTPAGVPL